MITITSPKEYNPNFYTIGVNQATDPRAKFDYEISLDFTYRKASDIVVKGGAFNGYWNGEKWSLSQDDLIEKIDYDISKVYNQLKTAHPDAKIKVSYMNNESSGYMLRFNNYCKKQMPSEVQFNSKVFFSDQTPVREDYSTYQLSYRPLDGKTPAFDELMKELYTKDNLNKILWSLGALFSGRMPKIEKFLFLYGAAGTGKGTVLKVIDWMLGEYVAPIDLTGLTGKSEFATGDIKEVPLLVDTDTDISRTTSDKNLLKLTSHEPVLVRKLYKEAYPVTFNGLLVTASNERYDARNSDSGIIRRALVARPTGNTVPLHTYRRLMDCIKYEIPYIVKKCIDFFNSVDESFYANEKDEEMIRWNDKFYDCVMENIHIFEKGVTLNQAVEVYKNYLTEYDYTLTGAKNKVRNEIAKFYIHHAKDTVNAEGNRVYNYYYDFKHPNTPQNPIVVKKDKPLLEKMGLKEDGYNYFNENCSDCFAQYTTAAGTPRKKWSDVTTKLSDIDVQELHYVQVPEELIVIDFDLKDEEGEKSLKRNIEAALKYPPTYTEVSKSGGGIHLHYHYDGDVSLLDPNPEPGIEVKVYTGKQALRRKCIFYNNKPVTHISSGLKLKEKETSMFKDVEDMVWTEKKLTNFLDNCLDKIHHGATKPEVDFAYSVLCDARDSGVEYDLVGYLDKFINFAMHSTHQSSYCMDIVSKMPFSTTKEREVNNTSTIEIPQKDLVFYDVEVFSNLFLICWKKKGLKIPDWIFDNMSVLANGQVITNYEEPYQKEWLALHGNEYDVMFNPAGSSVESLTNKPLVGFNCRNYDNHILYARIIGHNNQDLYNISQRIISDKDNNAKFAGAYNLSYADVYEFLDKKQSLKKWEIGLGLKHNEFEFPWDKPLPTEHWVDCARYCMDDVDATDEVFSDKKSGQASYNARLILCELTQMPVITKTQTLAAKFLFGDDPRPQDKFIWYDLAKEFPGYKFDKYAKVKSTYQGELPSEGGWVKSKPGVYGYHKNETAIVNGRHKSVIYIDVESLHPHSLIAINYFGPYTPKFAALVKCRMLIKHKKLEEASHVFDDIDPALSEKLRPYITNEDTATGLAYALKIVINTIYGMSSASYDNPFRAPDNIDNIIAKRGALFMIMLYKELEERGCNIIHVKTDSMKITNYTDEDIEYAMKRANEFGYNFDTECIYDRIVLVNKSTLIGHHEGQPETGKEAWEAVGAQFAVPFVYKTLFSKEDVVESDFNIFKSVKSSIYLGDTFIGKNANVFASNNGQDLWATREINISQAIQSRMLKPTEKYLPKRDYIDKTDEEILNNKITKISSEVDYPEEDIRRLINAGYPEELVTRRNYVTGTKGHKWSLANEYTSRDDVDMSYYTGLVSDAVNDIYKVGDGNLIFEGTQYERTEN